MYIFLNDRLELWETIGICKYFQFYVWSLHLTILFLFATGLLVIYVTFALVVIGDRVISHRILKTKRHCRE